MRGVTETSKHLLAWLGITGIGLLVGPMPAGAVTIGRDDAESSPLFSAEVKRAFANMTARDSHLAPGQPRVAAFTLTPDEVVVVEGTSWHRQAVGEQTINVAAAAKVATKESPRPMETLASPSCGMTCVSYPTCGGNATCTPDATCNGTCTFYPTCSGSGQATCSWSCDTTPTCSGYATCAGNNTCGYTPPTCSVYPTCAGYNTCASAPTCASPTCSGATCFYTCAVNYCPAPALSNITVRTIGPPPREQYDVQMSFNAAGSVRYTVLYCTNLHGAWSNVFSKLGDGTTTTFAHTNEAPRAYYRVLMQNP